MTRIEQPFRASQFIPHGSSDLVEIYFLKSTKSVKFNRAFNKIDAYFSYVGGLVGTIIGLFFIMGPYSEKAYEVSIAKKLLKKDENE